jgi:uncharacterized membrane protein
MAQNERQFPTAAGIFFGLGLGGFFDGIVLHQLLQWHHMVTSAGYPADSVDNLKLNTLLDGVFHASTYILSLSDLPCCGGPHIGLTCGGPTGCSSGHC